MSLPVPESAVYYLLWPAYIPYMSRGYSKTLPDPFQLLSFSYCSLSRNNWSKTVYYIHYQLDHKQSLSRLIRSCLATGYYPCVRPIFEYGIVSTTTVSDSVINKIQRVQNSFIRLALCLLKYVPVRLLHKASGLPYVRERLITVGQNHLARCMQTPSLSIQSTQLGPT